MNKSLTKPLIRPLGGRWARVCLTALLTAVVTVGAQARATCESGTPSQTQTQTRACADSLGGAQARTACAIFLPATGYREGSVLYNVSEGYYWSSSLSTAYSYNARYLDFGSGRHDRNVNPLLLRVLGAARPPINLSCPRGHDAIESI